MAEQEEERIMVFPCGPPGRVSHGPNPAGDQGDSRARAAHLKPDRIFIDDVLNEYLWKRGREHPPRRIRVKAIKFEDGSAVVSLPED